MSTFLRMVEAARQYARALAEADKRVKPHPYERDPHSGAGNCAECSRPEHFWAHWRPEW